jgi:hypothetical protein
MKAGQKHENRNGRISVLFLVATREGVPVGPNQLEDFSQLDAS